MFFIKYRITLRECAEVAYIVYNMYELSSYNILESELVGLINKGHKVLNADCIDGKIEIKEWFKCALGEMKADMLGIGGELVLGKGDYRNTIIKINEYFKYIKLCRYGDEVLLLDLLVGKYEIVDKDTEDAMDRSVINKEYLISDISNSLIDDINKKYYKYMAKSSLVGNRIKFKYTILDENNVVMTNIKGKGDILIPKFITGISVKNLIERKGATGIGELEMYDMNIIAHDGVKYMDLTRGDRFKNRINIPCISKFGIIEGV